MGQPLQLGEEAAAGMSSRLAMLPELVLPGQMTRGGAEPSEAARRGYLSALATRDAGVFLERHGELLQEHELAAFQHLRCDGSGLAP